MRIEIPQLALIAIVGASASGKTTFAHKYFKPNEVLSSDFFRGMVGEEENDQSVTNEAFELLYKAAALRLTLGRSAVIDATNLQKNSRKSIIELAKRQNVHAVAIVLDIPMKTLLERNNQRSDKQLSEGTIRRHYEQLHSSIKSLKKEGFRFVYMLSENDVDNAEIVRTKLWNNKRDENGPFDIIGDVHGCFDELAELLDKLGYVKNDDGVYYNPEGRKAVFLGDLCDRGNKNTDVLKAVMSMVKNGYALAVPGNHDVKLVKYLLGKRVQTTNGLETTLNELNSESREFKKEICNFLDGLVSHYVLDDGRLVVSHAGIKQEYIGRASAAVRDFCLYGDVDGTTAEDGMPLRKDWAANYRGKAVIVYGHTPVFEVRNRNNTYCIDTGCVFGGSLTALRYPEMETVSVKAKRTYSEPAKPFVTQTADDIPIAEELLGKLRIETDLIPSITVQEENTASAFEVMSRFSADPRWLIYLPPTMSPCETSTSDEYLEYPTEAFAYYRKNGIRNVVCEKKHMGSRAVIVLCRNAETARKRFSVDDGSRGIIYTRTGRRFFENRETENVLLERFDTVLDKTGFWNDFNTDWVCLDTELMPWSEKAQGLIKEQYAAIGHAAVHSLEKVVQELYKAYARDKDVKTEHSISTEKLLYLFGSKHRAAERFYKVYGNYCWKVSSIDDFRIAPFHILACEGNVFTDKSHKWHMDTIEKYIAGNDKIFVMTPHVYVDTEDEDSIAAGIRWWEGVTDSGGEGMVVKPEFFTSYSGRKLLQPAIKCRGREYLRIIYGAEYLNKENLPRLKQRSLKRKRDLALKEFALGVEGLKRFVKNEPLYRINQCAFGVLAMESEPTDPRL